MKTLLVFIPFSVVNAKMLTAALDTQKALGGKQLRGLLSGACGEGNRGNGICSDGTCCSQYGWCGTSPEHCSDGGNGDNPSAGTCGGGNQGNGICSDGACCSQYGWCGTSPDHCSGGGNGGTPNVGTCGGGNQGNGICADGTCCSQYGWCGTSPDHCADGGNDDTPSTGTCGGGRQGNGICADGTCCSQHGWCGTSPAHCSGTGDDDGGDDGGDDDGDDGGDDGSDDGGDGGDDGASARVEAALDSNKDKIDTEIFLYKTPQNTWQQSTIYRFDGFISGIRVMYETGIDGKKFYMGEDNQVNGHLYGIVNIAAFLAQSMKETIQYDACDENSWDLVNGRYPLSNACGQLGQSYQDYHCSADEKHMECPVDKDMEIKAVTNAKWYGAPQPLYCGPKALYPATGYWDYTAECNMPWASPPQTCTAYPGQQAGKENNSVTTANSAGRTDVEGCCWWGRGVIQTTGVCNFGKLNYFLGKRAHDEGRPSRYPTIDFCTSPETICASEEHQELKWIAGFFYWITSVQEYNESGWSYISKLKQFVDGGMTDTSFIDSVSAIVNRGCALPPCPAGPVDGAVERAANFQKVLQALGVM